MTADHEPILDVNVARISLSSKIKLNYIYTRINRRKEIEGGFMY